MACWSHRKNSTPIYKTEGRINATKLFSGLYARLLGFLTVVLVCVSVAAAQQPQGYRELRWRIALCKLDESRIQYKSYGKVMSHRSDSRLGRQPRSME